MKPWTDRALAAVAALLLLACVLSLNALLCEVRAEAAPMRVMDPPVVSYPQTRECALHGSTVELRFGGESYDVRPTREELLYGMRYSREP